MDALSGAAIRALELLGVEDAARVFTTVGREQEYFLIDEQYYFERPDLLTTGRTLFGAKPPKGHELDDHYFGSIPERILACMLEVELELAKLGVPIKTRHNEVAPNQYEVAPIFENSNVGSDHQMLTMQIMQNTARRYGLVCLLHEKPFAGVNGSGKHNNWSMGTDTGLNLLEPGRHAAREPAVPVLLRGGDPGRQQAPGAAARVDRQRRARTTASAPTRRRRRSSRSSSAPSSRRSSRRSRAARSQASKPGSFLGLGTPVLPPLPLHGGDRNRTSPFAFTGNKFEFRALGSSSSPALPEHGAEHDRRRVDRRARRQAQDGARKARARRSRRPSRASSRSVWAANKQIVFDGDNYSEEWHKEAEKRGLANLRTTPDALPWLVDKQTVAAFKKYKVLSKRELESRYEVFTEQYVDRTSTSRPRRPRRSRARCCCRRPCATSTNCRPAASRSWSARSSR